MRVLLQRVTEASVTVEQRKVAEIGAGLLVFVGVEPKDTSVQIAKLVDKTLGLRIFPGNDQTQPKDMDRSVLDVAGEVLVVSQFTLAGDTSKGKRPGFSTAAPPALAEPLFDEFVADIRVSCSRVQQGVFGADMQVALINDGPVTFVLDA